MVTVIKTKGSTPRGTGTKMIVCADGDIYGTVGGSAVEALIVEEARKCIQNQTFKKVRHTLDDPEREDTGMICGGEMEFFIEPITIPPHLIIFGGGHVALPLARLASQIGFSYTIVEDRTEYAGRDRFPDAKDIIVTNEEQFGQDVSFTPTDYVAIVTRSHDIDYVALKAVLKYPVKYIGLIASKRKKKQVFEKLKADGFKDSEIRMIHSPIGLDIAAQTPAEIAVSIVAELIQVKNQT